MANRRNVKITKLISEDIPGAISCIQQAFAQDPYNNWVFNRATVGRQKVMSPALAVITDAPVFIRSKPPVPEVEMLMGDEQRYTRRCKGHRGRIQG